MSNYPSPYGPPPGYAMPPGSMQPPSPLRTAQRAGWLMLSIGFLVLLGGGCFSAGAFLPTDQLPPEASQNFNQIETAFHASFKTVFLTMGVVLMVFGLYHVVVSFFVRRGVRPALITAIASSILVIGWCGINALGGLVAGAANAALGVCFSFLIVVLFGWLLAWLFQALRNASGHGATAQYQAQYWQYQQQQQAYAQAYGHPPGYVAPPNAPQASSYPPPPPVANTGGWAYGAPPPPPPTSPAPAQQHYPSAGQAAADADGPPTDG